MQSLAIFGITGRMGQALLRALREAVAAGAAAGEGTALPAVVSTLRLRGALASPNSHRLGREAAAEGEPTGVVITADPAVALSGATVALDFSAAQCVAAHGLACAAAGVPLLVGTTGLDAAGRAALERAAEHIPVLIAPNTSVAITLMATLVSLAAARLDAAYEVEVFDAHHRLKRDAPSGTALALGQVVAAARGQTLHDVTVYDWLGENSPRRPGSIVFSVLREGDIVGEHRVTFSGAGESLEITHRATDRMIFARGALKATEWLVRQSAGLYGMQDVIGL